MWELDGNGLLEIKDGHGLSRLLEWPPLVRLQAAMRFLGGSWGIPWQGGGGKFLEEDWDIKGLLFIMVYIEVEILLWGIWSEIFSQVIQNCETKNIN